MDISVFNGEVLSFEGDLLVVGRFQDQAASRDETAIDQALNGALSRRAERHLFKGKAGQKVAVDTVGQIKADRVVLVGLGEQEAFTGKAVRDRAADMAREALSSRSDSVALMLANDLDAAAATELVLGFELGLYRFDALQTPKKDAPKHEVGSLSIGVIRKLI